MKKILQRASLICSIILSVIAVSNAQKKVIYYWDFNQTHPSGGGGKDSLGTSYSYANTVLADSLHKTFTLYAPYSTEGATAGYIEYFRPSFHVNHCPNHPKNDRDSIIDNGSGGAVGLANNELKNLLGNDTGSSAAGNLYIRTRNPSDSCYFYMYMPTTGYDSIILNYAISSSSTKGPLYAVFSYSTNGGATWNKLTSAMDTFNIHSVRRPDTLQLINPTTAASNWYPVRINFTSDPSVGNNPNFILRWYMAGFKPSYLPTDSAACYSSGNARFDNFSLTGDSLCPYFTSRPVTVTFCGSGGSASYVAHIAGPGPYTLNWQIDSGSGWSDIPNTAPFSGVHTDSLVVNPVAGNMNLWAFRLQLLSNTCGTSFSGIARLLVDPYLSDSIIAVTNVGCNTLGSITIGVSGGTSPYTYLWSPGGQTTATATGLTAGNYTVTVTDNYGCSGTQTATVGSPANVPQVLILSQTNIECNTTGNATVLVVHGTSPYTYLWNPGGQTTATATGLSLGTYTITVTDSNGCQGTNTVTITSTPFVRDSIIGLGSFAVIHYWDFNQTPPSGGGGGDSLGTSTYPLLAPYTLIPGGNPRIVYSRPKTKLISATTRDSILDNGDGPPYAYVNDLNNVPAINAVLGNDSASGNLFIRSRNPDSNSYMYMYIPTTGYKNISLNYALSASSTKGALYNIFSYSTNGGTSWNKLTASMDTFNTGGHRHPDTLQVINAITSGSDWDPININFSSDPNTNNNPNFIVRWYFAGASSTGTSGNDRYDNFSVSGYQTEEACNGGSNFNAIAGVKYGVSPYTYSWSPSGGTSDTATVSAGTYTVTVTDANGCSATSSITISQPTAITASITSTTNLLCNGANTGEATASGSGGTSPYLYSWSNSATGATATGLSAGTYTVTVTDAHGCTGTTSATITQPSAIRDSISATNTGCGSSNGTATVGVIDGTSPYTYLWSNGQTNATATGLGSGSYTVTITDHNGCTASTSVTIVSPAGLRDSITSTTSPTCNGGTGTATVGVSGGTPAYTYVWSPIGGTNATGTGLTAGTYTVMVTDANGCSASSTAVISQPVAIRDSIVSVVGPQVVIDYWDFNNTLPAGGNGGDSLGTATYPLPAQYSLVSNSKIVYSRPSAHQTSPLVVTGTFKDSILDNGSPGAYVNDLHILGNDTNSLSQDNLFVRSRNPDENSMFYLYLPTTGYSNIEMNYAISASSTKGALYNIFSYSTNGGADLFANKLTAAMDTFNTGGHNHPDSLQMINPTTAASLWYAVHINFSSDPRINNNPNFILRWEYEGTSCNGTSGNDRYDNISLVGDASNEVCNGQDDVSATVGVKYGTSPYTYAWAPSGGTNATASNLSAATYTVDITDANGCTGSATVTITQPTLLTSTPTFTGVLCNGGSTGTASANASGGTPAYTYLWSPGGKTTATITGLSIGTYTVTVNDHNLCSVVATVTITQPAAIAVTTSMTAATCNTTNGTATASVSGGTSPYTYLWTPGSQTNATATGLAAGNYTVTVTDANGCSGTGTINVTGTGENATASVNTEVGCNGGSTGSANSSVTGGTLPYTYLWNPGGNTNANVSGLSAGTYTLTVHDNNGCTSTATVTITQPAALRDSLVASGNTTILHYWDFNQTMTVGGNGGDSLGTEYSYANTFTVDTTNKTAPLYAPYTVIAGGARIVYVRPSAIQSPATERDSILDNGSGGSFINDLNKIPAINTVLGNDSAGTNLYVRSRNPDKNSYMYVYAPTTGYQNIQISYAIEESSAKGAQYNILSYSTNGGSTWNNLPRSVDTFSVGHQPTPDTLTVNGDLNWSGPYTLNFSHVAAVNNNPNFVLRWSFAGSASSGSSGNDRYDNVSVSGNAVNELCSGGNNVDLSADVSGGTGPYTYTWSPNVSTTNTADNLSAGTYTVDVTDANGCTFSSSLTVTQPALLAAAPTETGVLCNGGSTGTASANASGGTPAYTYLWSNSQTGATATGLSAGSYTVTVKDFNGCSTTASITVTQPVALRDSIAAVNNGCFGSNNGTATVGVKYGTSPYTYLWSNSQTNVTATGLSAGTYTVLVTDANGCMATASTTITTPTQLTSLITGTTSPTCNGGTGTATVGVSGGTPAYTYVWSPIGGTNATGTGLTAGTYTVMVTDANGCSASSTAVISQPVAIRDSIVSVVGPQVVIDYWDFNNTLPAGGNGGDSLGTATYPLPAQYSLVSNSKIVYSRPSAHQTSPLVVTGTFKDSILDNGSPGAYVNDLHILGNDTNSLSQDNLFVRSRNPDENSMFYLYLPTTGYSNIEMNYAISASSTKGALYNIFSYSTNGGADLFANKLTAAMDTFNTGGHNHPDSLQMINPTTAASLWYAVHINFSSDPRINNNPNFILRWEYEGTSCNGTSGNDRYDNISLVGDASNEVCNGQDDVSATVGVKYGTSPYTYAWAPSGGTNATASNLSAATYTVDITDANGCTGSATVTITQPTLLTSTPTFTGVLCNGGSTGTASANASGGTPAYTYLWSPGGKTTATITGLSIGTYTVTVNDHNLCSVVATVTITQPAAIAVTTSMTAATCNTTNGTATASVSGGTSPYTYLWTPGSQTNATATGLAAGNYTVTVTDANGCSGTGTINVTGTGENATASVNTEVGCNGGSTGSANSSVTGGTLPYTYLWNPGGNTNANVSGLSAGTYTLTVHDNNGCTSTATVTITQPAALRDSLVASGNTTILHYWDFNQTMTVGGNGGDSLGTEYSYANTFTVDTTNKTAPLYAPYTVIAGGARIVYVRPSAIQSPATERDSILDNGSGGSFINDLNKIPAINTVLGNDSAGTNLYVRSRNPDKNSYMYVYAPTTGYQNIQISYAIEESSAKGAQYNILSYSTNGGSTWNNLPRSVDTFSVGHQPTPDTLTVNGDLNWSGPYTLNFSHVAAVNNNPNFVLRWSFAGSASSGSSGNDRYDNVSVSGNAVNELCSGGNNVDLSADVSGGTGPYTYTWSPNVSTTNTADNLSAGTYTVDVTDANGCTFSSSLTVTQPALLAAAPTETGVLCNGGSTGTASANASGGTPAYTYLWSNSQTGATATGLSAGSYTVTVKDFNGCSTTASITVTQPVALRDSIAAVNNGCFGSNNGTATVGVKYGTSPYTYLWSNSQTNVTATGLSAGTYTVLVTDANGCMATASTTITTPTQLTSLITGTTSPTCNGGTGTATVGVSGGTPAYTYVWSPIGGTNATGTGLTAGTYTVMVTDANGCSASSTAVISQPVAIRDSIVSVVGPQVVIDYWDFNNTLPAGGNGGDSLGTATYPLPAQYSLVSNSKIVYSRPSAHQTSPLVVTGTFKDSILDNGSPGAYVNDLHILGNDTNSLSQDNLFVRSRNPDENSMFYLYLPTTGYSNIEMNYAISASSTKGALYNIFSYSTNGGADLFANKLTAAMDTFNTGGHNHPDSLQMINPTTAASLWYAVHINFSSDPRINNNPNFILRWEYEGTSCNGTSGNDRYDNISLVGDASNEVCNGQDDVSATVGVKYGTSPYTYAWAPSGGTNATASNLSAATYTVDITDANGCTGSATVTITQPTLLTSTPTFTGVLCNGGSTGTASANASGGTPAYTYLWSPGGKTTATITGLSIGTYTVTVNDHNLCSVVATVTITQPAAIAVTTSMTAATCNTTNGTATASVSGGTSPYTYLWTPGSQTNATATGLAAGNYTVTVTDANGCSGTGTINVTGTGENATASVNTEVGCNGGSTGSANSSVTGGTLPYTYLWNPGGNTNANVSGLSAGTYTLTVHDNNGCTSTATVTITQPAALRDSLVASGNTTILHYWDFNQTMTVGGNGGDSLGTEYSYANTFTVDTTNKTAPLYAPYTVIAGGARIVYVRPSAIQSPATERDSILDNGSGGSFINDLNKIPAINTVLGNDSAGTNLYVRSRNPDKNSYMYVYAPTTGYQNIQISYAIEESSAKGAQYNILSYSTNGGSTWNNLPRSVDTFSVGHQPTPDTLTVNGDLNWSGPYTLNFSHVAAVNNNPNFVLRWSFAGSASSGSSGNDRYDNVSVSGNAVNELCSGGNNVDLSADVSGGTGPYTYTWSPNVSTTNTADNLSAGTYTVDVTDANGCTFSSSLTVTQPALLAAAPTETGVLCNGGSTGTASANASGGTPAYTYSWTGGKTTATITGLSAGTYTVTVKDFNGCSTTASIIVTQPIALRDSISSSTNGCFGNTNGTATVGVKYGTSPYTYLWSNSQTNITATGLSAGTYTVLVTDNNGCTTTATTTLTQPAQLRDSIIASTTVNCNGGLGSATVGVAGGNSPYTYSWSPIGGTNATGTGLTVGSYTVTVTDNNGCTTSATVTLTQPPSVSITPSVVTEVNCNGNSTGSASVTVNTGTPAYTYSWTPSGQTTSSATGLSAGSYTITVYDANGCSNSATVSVTQPAAIRDSVSAQTNVACNGSGSGSATIGVKGGTSPYTYSWSPNTNNTATATGLSAGNYTVTVTDKNGCNNTVLVTITQNSDLRDSLASITYPLCHGGTGSATIGVKGGTSPYTYTWAPNVSSTFTASGLSVGTYTVNVKDNFGCNGTAIVFTVTQPNAIHDSIVASSKVNVACNGGDNGSATVGVKYGTSPYTYTWSPNVSTSAIATGLSAGTYSVTITDANGCSGTTAIVTITQPSIVRDSVSAMTEVKCQGGNTGSATIGVKGGTSPYTYAWSPNTNTTATATGLSAGTYTITVKDHNGCSSTVLVTLTQPAAIRDSLASITYPLCNGGDGSATVGVKYGAAPYTYAWTRSLSTTATCTALTAGTYTVTVTDHNGCTGTTVTILITQPIAIHDSVVKTLTTYPKCNGETGTATAGVKYGTAPYTYLWTPSGQTTVTATGLSAGTYSLTVKDANGCTGTTATVVITQPSPLRDSVSTETGPTCNGGGNGRATIGVKDGTSPYTYLWNNGQTNSQATGLSAGTYTVTVTDKNGCSSTVLATVTQPAAIRDSLVSLIDPLCNGGTGTATLGVKGGTAPYTYKWTPNVSSTATCTNLTVGSYTVTITDNHGCNVIFNFTITQPAAIRDSIVNASTVNDLCNGGNSGSATVGVKYGTSPYTYTWSPNVSSTATATGLSAGSYTVTITDAHGCTGTAAVVTITQPATALRDSISAITQVACNGGTGSATIGAKYGTSPYTYLWTPTGKTTASATGLSAGTYSVSVTDNHGCSNTVIVTITQPSAIRDSVVSMTIPNCNASNGVITIGVKGGTSPYTYIWNPNVSSASTATGLVAGTYSITIEDNNGCSGSAIVINLISAAGVRDSIVTSATVNETCNGGSTGSATVGVKNGVTPYTYFWTPNVSSTATATGLSAGTYSVYVEDNNGCKGGTVVVTITQPAAIRDSVSSMTGTIVCNGGSGVTVVIGVKGGTSPYTYTWSPNISSTATASNLSAGTYSVTVTDINGCTSSTAIFTVTQPAAITDSLASVSYPACNGETGSVTIGVKGGTVPYTYVWSPNVSSTSSATGLSARSYTVTVKDSKGCSGIFTFTITQPGIIRDSIVKASTVNISCYGDDNGSATIGVKGGTPAYTYTWSPNVSSTSTASGLSAGTYSISIKDANGCVGTVATVTITQPAGILRDSIASQRGAVCNGGGGGLALLGVKGGTSPYTYLWSNGQTTQDATGLSAGTYTATVTDNHGCSETTTVTITQPTAIRDSLVSFNDPLCHGGTGSVVIGVTGGTAPYTYKWTPNVSTTATATALVPSTYNVVIKDNNGCNVTLTFTITQPVAIHDSIIKTSTTNVSCNGGDNGSATVGVKYGTAPYTYTWSPSISTTATATGMSAGVYTVTVTDVNGCTGTAATVTITQPGAIRDSATAVTGVECNGGNTGKATIGVKYGTSPYTYLWTPGGQTTATVSTLTAGTYTVDITDAHGCTGTATVTITQNAAIRDSLARVTYPECTPDGSATIGVTGGVGPYTYKWSPSVSTTATASSLAVGSYTVTIHDHNDCSSVLTFTITQPPHIRDSIALENCNDGQGTATVGVKYGTPAYTYSWSPGGYTTATVSTLSNGSYTITVTDANGCIATTTVSFSCPPIVVKRDKAPTTDTCCPPAGFGNVNIYPNPTTGEFTIDGLIQGQIIQLYNYAGNLLKTVTVDKPEMRLNISDQPNGLYLIRILNNEGTLVTQKKLIKTW